jgi:hypothetical protein
MIKRKLVNDLLVLLTSHGVSFSDKEKRLPLFATRTSFAALRYFRRSSGPGHEK